MTPPAPRLPPIFRYFASKWRSAPRYPAPRHPIVIEPFAGGAGYSHLWWDRAVILLEKNPMVVEIWRWLLQASPQEILSLPLIEPGESIEGFDLPRPAKNWIGYWNTISGAKPQLRMVPSAATLRASFWGAHIRARTAETVQRIRHWSVLQGDFSLAPDVPATWFIDPPYRGRPEFGSADIDYGALGTWCRSRQGQLIVCEAEGADWLPFKPLGSLHAAPRAQHGGRAARRTAEVCYAR
jgi:hypothetical protein